MEEKGSEDKKMWSLIQQSIFEGVAIDSTEMPFEELLRVEDTFSKPFESENLKRKELSIPESFKKYRCQVSGCSKAPFFNKKERKIPRFCHDHKGPEMICIIPGVCEAEGCLDLPLFNFPHFKRGRFCRKHKDPEMVKIGNYRNCEFQNCKRKATHNLKTLRPQFCFRHRGVGMINVVKNTCDREDCNKKAFFNEKGLSRARFCNEHKLEGMTNVKHRICQFKDCKKRAYCNLDELRIPKFCGEHKVICNDSMTTES